MVTAGHLVETYTQEAGTAGEKALKLQGRPQPRTWEFKGPFPQQASLDNAHAYAFQQKFMCLYSALNSVTEEGAYGPLQAFAEGVPVDGFYDVTVQAEALNRRNPYDPSLFGMDPDAPFRLVVVPGTIMAGPLHKE